MKSFQESISKYRNTFISHASEIANNIKEKMPNVSENDLKKYVRKVLLNMALEKSNPNYKNTEKFMPKNFDKKLYDNGDSNSYESEFMSQTDAKIDTIIKKGIAKSIKEELGAGEWGTNELTDKYKNETPGQNESTDKEKDIEDLMKMIKNPDPKRVKEYGGKDEYVSMLKDKVKKLMKEAYIGEDLNEEKFSLESELGGTEEQRVQLLKLYGKALKAVPHSPRQKKINAEIEMLRKKMKKSVNEETLSEAAPIRRLLATNNLYRYFSDIPKVTGMNPNDVVGVIWGLKSVKGYSEFYLWNFDAYDKSVTKHIKLKSGEKLFRYVSHTTAASNLKPMIKVNVAKSLAYFLKQDEEGEYMDPPEFESKGVKFNGIQLTEDGAKGLDISNWTEIVRESNKLTDNFERQLFERLAQDDAYVDRDYDVVKKEWDKAKDKNKVIQKYGLKSAFSNLRGGEIKLGISNELKTRPKRKIAALDGDKLIYVTGWPMKIHFHEEFVNESMNIEKMFKNPEMEISEEDAINLFSELSINKSLMKKIKEMPSYKDGQKAKNINDNPYGKSNSSKGSVNYWIWNYGFDDEIL